jgi:hypothetical protein
MAIVVLGLVLAWGGWFLAQTARSGAPEPRGLLLFLLLVGWVVLIQGGGFWVWLVWRSLRPKAVEGTIDHLRATQASPFEPHGSLILRVDQSRYLLPRCRPKLADTLCVGQSVRLWAGPFGVIAGLAKLDSSR